MKVNTNRNSLDLKVVVPEVVGIRNRKGGARECDFPFDPLLKGCSRRPGGPRAHIRGLRLALRKVEIHRI